jgi:biopolymer transport protein ExbB
MTAKFVKATAFVVAGAFASVAAFAQDEAAPAAPAGPTPQEVAAENLDQLLKLVEQGRISASQENAAREKRFAQDKANQAAELRKAEQERTREEQRSARLEKQFEKNELLIAASRSS